MPGSPKTTTAPTGAIAPFGLRMLPELRTQLEEAARASGRSMNAEIIARLQASFAPATTSDPTFDVRVQERINEARVEAVRSQIYTVQMHAEVLSQRLDAAKRENRSLAEVRDTEEKLARADAELKQLKKRHVALIDENHQLAHDYSQAVKPVDFAVLVQSALSGVTK